MKDAPHPVVIEKSNEEFETASAIFYVGHRWTGWEKPPGQRPFRRCLECPAIEVKPLLNLP